MASDMIKDHSDSEKGGGLGPLLGSHYDVVHPEEASAADGFEDPDITSGSPEGFSILTTQSYYGF